MDDNLKALEQELATNTTQLQEATAREEKTATTLQIALQTHNEARRESNKATGLRLPNALDAQEKSELAEFRYLKAKKAHEEAIAKRHELTMELRSTERELATAQERLNLVKSYDATVGSAESEYLGIHHDDTSVTFEMNSYDNIVTITAYELDQMILKLTAIAAKLQ